MRIMMLALNASHLDTLAIVLAFLANSSTRLALDIPETILTYCAIHGVYEHLHMMFQIER